jgi:tRNA U34 5-methylaminomethyl-2-thiouridine-forming methyltransferase MnmC
MTPLLTNDGSHTLFSETYGVTYHSKFGAVTESAHVFIAAGLRYKAVVQRDIRILEVGFGTGLNAFMTWIEAEKRNLNVAYTGLETHPLTKENAALFNFCQQLQVAERHPDFASLHELGWEERHVLSEQFSFEKRLADLRAFEEPDSYDVVYFDAFAPQAQPELWTEDVFLRMYRALRPEGILVTYCAQGEFKRTLKKAGFQVEKLQGPPGKREMTRALK